MPRYRACACTSCPAHDGSCPELSLNRHCPDCSSQREQRRGSRHARGYDADHVARREQLLAQLTPGQPCPKCHAPMWAWQDLDAGHSVDLRTNPNAKADQLEHRGCNRGWRRGT